MTELSAGQFELVCNFFSMTIAAMGAAFIFFTGVRSLVAPKFHVAMLVSSAIVAITCYNYFCIASSWKDAFILSGSGTYVPSGRPFNNGLHLFDWILTGPLIAVALVAVQRKMPPEQIIPWHSTVRLLLIVTLVLYPISFMLPIFGINVDIHMKNIQIGYALSDLATKVFYGVLIYRVACIKSETEN